MVTTLQVPAYVLPEPIDLSPASDRQTFLIDNPKMFDPTQLVVWSPCSRSFTKIRSWRHFSRVIKRNNCSSSPTVYRRKRRNEE